MPGKCWVLLMCEKHLHIYRNHMETHSEKFVLDPDLLCFSTERTITVLHHTEHGKADGNVLRKSYRTMMLTSYVYKRSGS